ncbi:hypothetical protein BABINDRAFT_163935 [Babjeviella inositovora NRRL Y-12698]|uniref:alanine--glyoxylate transaminase n=1 Tax=Babjeviella inositovora NRRL Y-12698 TaxID=984486 RepID=A0A1E3QGX1_9ASCO|nr:uncharacterized protein BABINDRAFT_163935 [Babjeviella inositovora NRRL Y-12698]ODQ76931.1 hypothetical protein BABINDRAFT_163935 [Babjeviella inositovora NRRL Y-12698]
MSCPYKQPAHQLTMIPGPIEFSDEVLYAMSTPSQSHTSTEFVATFLSTLKQLRKIFKSTDPKAQPYVVAGSGTLGWDMAASSLLEAGDKALVLSTGFFSDSFAEALRVYDINVDVISAPVGDVVPLAKVAEALQKTKYQAITITHVDTSTAVVSDIKAIAAKVRELSPETLIIIDGVCSVGAEDIEFDSWGLDYVLTGSQKALGCPAGLSISFASARAQAKVLSRAKPATFFASMKRWTPVMQAYEAGSGAYFATPAIQTITALNVALKQILDEGLDARLAKQAQVSDKFKQDLASLGLQIVPVSTKVAAHGLTGIYFPEGVAGGDLLAKIAGKGINVAGGIHKDIKTKYFRVGHMGVSAYRGDVGLVLQALKEALAELGYKK